MAGQDRHQTLKILSDVRLGGLEAVESTCLKRAVGGGELAFFARAVRENMTSLKLFWKWAAVGEVRCEAVG